MFPEIWLPTCTLTTALSVPVAVTLLVMSMRFAGAVRYFGASSFLRRNQNAHAPPPSSASSTTHQIHENPPRLLIDCIFCRIFGGDSTPGLFIAMRL